MRHNDYFIKIDWSPNITGIKDQIGLIQLNWPQTSYRMFTLQLVSKGRQQTVRMCFRWRKKWSWGEAGGSAAFMCAWLPPGSCSGHCRRYLTGVRVEGVGVEGTHGLQQIENSPLSHRFVRLTRSFTSASVLRGVIVWGSRKDARMHRNWDVWRFITSVTSLNTQSEQWDPHYKWGPWQYKKNFALHPLARRTVINDDFKLDQSLSKMF